LIYNLKTIIYNDLVVPIRNDGMINATELCKAGNKLIADGTIMVSLTDNGTYVLPNNYLYPYWDIPVTLCKIVLSSNGQYMAYPCNEGIYISNDYGSTFTNRFNINLYGYLVQMFMSLSGQMISCLVSRKYYVSNDYGNTFVIPSSLPISNNELCTVDISGKYHVLYNLAVNTSLFVSSDYGITFRNINISGHSGITFTYIDKIKLSRDATMLYIYMNNNDNQSYGTFRIFWLITSNPSITIPLPLPHTPIYFKNTKADQSYIVPSNINLILWLCWCFC